MKKKKNPQIKKNEDFLVFFKTKSSNSFESLKRMVRNLVLKTDLIPIPIKMTVVNVC